MKENKLQERGLTRAQRYNRMMDKIFYDFKKQCNEMAEFLKDHGVPEEEIEELKKNTGLERNALDDKLTELGIRDEFFNREEIKESKGSKVLTEGTSNFWSMSNFPLLIFADYDSVYDQVYDMTAEELGDDFDGEIFDTKEFEDNWEKYFDYCTLTEEEQDELQDKIDKFNDKLKRMAWEKEDENDEYSPEAEVEIKPGYYEAAQLYVPNEKYLEDWQIKEIEKFLKAMKKEFGLTQLGVDWNASNGETGYHIIEGKKCVEEEKSVGQDVAEYQKWVDYDMKKYHKISNDTMNKIKKAGLSVVKDQYGDYEVIAYRPIKESNKKLKVGECKKLTEAKFIRSDHLAHGMYNGKMIIVYGELQDTRDYRWEDVHIEEEYDQVGFGRYKWLNRPWQRFTYAEAFRDAVVAWFGIQAKDKIDKAINESSNVQQALDKFMSSIGWEKDERTDEGLKK